MRHTVLSVNCNKCFQFHNLTNYHASATSNGIHVHIVAKIAPELKQPRDSQNEFGELNVHDTRNKKPWEGRAGRDYSPRTPPHNEKELADDSSPRMPCPLSRGVGELTRGASRASASRGSGRNRTRRGRPRRYERRYRRG